MKVLYIASGDYKYGASKSMMSLILALKNDYGVKPVLLTKKRNKLNEVCDDNGIENYSCWYSDFMCGAPYSFWPLKATKHIIKYILYIAGIFCQHKILTCGIDYESIDLIHTNHSRLQIGAYISEKKKLPHVWHIREFGKEDYNVFFYRPKTIPYMNQHANLFIAISDAVKKSWIQKGLDPDKVVTIYNGLDDKGYLRKKKRSDDLLKLVIVGHVQKSKGQLQLVQAVSLLPDDIRDHIQLDIIGEGYRDYIHQINKVIELNHLKNIHFVGYQDNVPEKLSEYDVGVMCSTAEGFGRVTVEYMFAGLFVIATDTGANPELITAPEQGMLYTNGNISELSECIKKVWDDRSKYCRGVSSPNVFTVERYAAEVYSVYGKLLKDNTNGY